MIELVDEETGLIVDLNTLPDNDPNLPGGLSFGGSLFQHKSLVKLSVSLVPVSLARDMKFQFLPLTPEGNCQWQLKQDDSSQNREVSVTCNNVRVIIGMRTSSVESISVAIHTTLVEGGNGDEEQR